MKTAKKMAMEDRTILYSSLHQAVVNTIATIDVKASANHKDSGEFSVSIRAWSQVSVRRTPLQETGAQPTKRDLKFLISTQKRSLSLAKAPKSLTSLPFSVASKRRSASTRVHVSSVTRDGVRTTHFSSLLNDYFEHACVLLLTL